MDSPKYIDFDVSEIPYKVVNDHEIKCNVLTPKNTYLGKHPVLVKFHGGFLITGASLYPAWFPQWALDYCLLHSAIIVAPDYRLLPESTGLDILEDVSDFWAWLHTDLHIHLAQSKPGIQADLARVAAYGESAGGYLAIQSGFSQPSGSIQAIIATYPAIDFESKFFSEAYEKSVRGAPMLPTSVLENHLQAMRRGQIITSVDPPERMNLCLSAVQQGRFPEFLGTDEILYPLRRLEMVDEMPFTLILHGRDDSAVPVEGSVEFAEKARRIYGDEKVLLHTEPGEHGFDDTATLETPWLKECLRHVTDLWINQVKP